MKPMLSHLLAALAATTVLSLCAAAGHAQTATTPAPFLKDARLTEEELTKALMPADDEIRTRGLRLVPGEQPRLKPRRKSDESGSGESQGSGAASLLITFETNATAISPTSVTALDKLARALKSEQLAQYKFDIEGHADPRGNADDNLRLSQGRAESVIEYLVNRHGIDSSRLRAVGKGDREPANPRDPAAPENRRVTVRNQSS